MHAMSDSLLVALLDNSVTSTIYSIYLYIYISDYDYKKLFTLGLLSLIRSVLHSTPLKHN